MKKLQLKYNILHGLYWIIFCCCNGYAAVFLQYKGLTNTQIGFVTGIGSVATIFLSPFITSLISKRKEITIRKVFNFVFILLSFFFLIMMFVDLPLILLMLLYISVLSFFVTTTPLLSMIAMNYTMMNREINFGLARGIGSVSYAFIALMMGSLIRRFDAMIIGILYIFCSVMFIVLLHSFDNFEIEHQGKEEKTSLMMIVKKYKIFFFILLGYSFNFAAASSLSTYLINIIKKLGGNTTLYGISLFIMAASEMPAMALTTKLMKRYNTMNLIIFSGICYLFRNILICIGPNIFFVFLGMAFQSVTYGLLTSLLAYYVLDVCVEKDQLMGQTLIGIMTSGIGSTLGNISGGIIQDTFGIDSMLVVVCFLTIIGTCIMVVSALVSKRNNHKVGIY